MAKAKLHLSFHPLAEASGNSRKSNIHCLIVSLSNCLIAELSQLLTFPTSHFQIFKSSHCLIVKLPSFIFYFWAMENGEQKIFVWCNFAEGMDDAILHGMMIALTLQKELCLFHQLDRKLHESIEMAEARLRGVAAKVSPILSNITVKYLVRDQEVKSSLTELAERFECLVLVAHKVSVPQLLPVLQYAAFPFLFVSAKDNIDQTYKRIVIPVGYMKKSKDLALWASYLGRHNGAMIDIFIADEGQGADQKDVKSNLFSIQRLYGKFRFPFQVIESHTPTWKLQKASLYHALGLKSGMLIIAASSNPTFLDSMLGLTEGKVIDKSEELSIMCVNSRRDFYTFCG